MYYWVIHSLNISHLLDVSSAFLSKTSTSSKQIILVARSWGGVSNPCIIYCQQSAETLGWDFLFTLEFEASQGHGARAMPRVVPTRRTQKGPEPAESPSQLEMLQSCCSHQFVLIKTFTSLSYSYIHIFPPSNTRAGHSLKRQKHTRPSSGFLFPPDYFFPVFFITSAYSPGASVLRNDFLPAEDDGRF